MRSEEFLAFSGCLGGAVFALILLERSPCARRVRGDGCAIGIGGGGVAWASRGWRGAVGIGGEGVAWMALRDWNWRSVDYHS